MSSSRGLPGLEYRQQWLTGETDERVMVDIMRRDDALPWDFSVQSLVGQVALTVTYGNVARRQVGQLATPLSVALPGAVTILARPVAVGPTEAMVSVSLAHQVGGIMRTVLLSAPDALPRGTYRYQALTASTIEVDGVPVAVPAGGSLDVTDPSELTAGDGFAEVAV